MFFIFAIFSLRQSQYHKRPFGHTRAGVKVHDDWGVSGERVTPDSPKFKTTVGKSGNILLYLSICFGRKSLQ